MTEVREQGFAIDLPGEWRETEADEPGAYIYRQLDGGDTVKVMLLSVRPMFTIADKLRLLADYAQHRSTYETGRMPTLVQYEPYFEERENEFEAWWAGEDTASAHKQQHRALLAGNVLVDACYASPQPEQAAFEKAAETVLATVTALAE
jgi:hypothetical protein